MKQIWIIGIMMLFLCSLVAAYSPSMTYEINPCTSSPTEYDTPELWANGTALTIKITGYACNKPTDPWNYCDSVKARAIIYFGDGFVQEDNTYWSTTWYNSHTEFIFSNWDTGQLGTFNMSLSVKTNDTESPVTTNYTYIKFQVIDKDVYDAANRSEEYVEYGDCKTTGIVGGPGVTPSGDAISTLLEGIEEQYNWSGVVIWILIMIVVGVSMMFFGGTMGIVPLIIVEFLLLLVGTYLTLIPIWILYLLVFVGVMIAGIKIYSIIGGK